MLSLKKGIVELTEVEIEVKTTKKVKMAIYDLYGNGEVCVRSNKQDMEFEYKNADEDEDIWTPIDEFSGWITGWDSPNDIAIFLSNLAELVRLTK